MGKRQEDEEGAGDAAGDIQRGGQGARGGETQVDGEEKDEGKEERQGPGHVSLCTRKQEGGMERRGGTQGGEMSREKTHGPWAPCGNEDCVVTCMLLPRAEREKPRGCSRLAAAHPTPDGQTAHHVLVLPKAPWDDLAILEARDGVRVDVGVRAVAVHVTLTLPHLRMLACTIVRQPPQTLAA
eukprot:211876-Chlamydomonas_euryale.AAC.1